MTKDRRGPVLIELDDSDAPNPAEGVHVGDAPDLPNGQAMQTVATLAARRPNKLARLFWGSLVALIGFVASLAAWEFITSLLTAQPVLGWIATGLTGVVLLTLLLIILREFAALSRLRRIDALREQADHALSQNDLQSARSLVARLDTLYKNRPDLALGRAALAKRRGEVFDAETLLAATETDLLISLDDAAQREVEAAARQVATVTALVPIALADVFTALAANLRMIRKVAEIYGGRAGTLGAWRLTRAVLTHLVATGAVAIGDDLLGSALGGSILSKVSRRFGEGIVNGALTARVGLAAMEVCRPLPFSATTRPSVTQLVRRSLTGVFNTNGSPE